MQQNCSRECVRELLSNEEYYDLIEHIKIC